MKKLAIAFLLVAALGLIDTVYAAPVEVTSCPFLMDSNTQYIVTQDMTCNFPFSFIDLSLGPINSSGNLNGHTVDVIDQHFIDDFGPYYDIEVYGGNVVNCGTGGGGCILWGGSGAGKLYVHHMNFSIIFSTGTEGLVTTPVTQLPAKQKIENVNVVQDKGYVITGWFLDLDVINTTISAQEGSGVFAVDGGNYFLDPFRHTGFAQNSDFDIGVDGAGSDGLGTSSVTLLDADINPLTECGNGCDLVTWTVLDNPPPINVTTSRDIMLNFKYNDNSDIKCTNCNKDDDKGNSVVKITTNKTTTEGCDYISGFMSSLITVNNSFKSVKIDKQICSSIPLLSAMPILNGMRLKDNNNLVTFSNKNK